MRIIFLILLLVLTVQFTFAEDKLIPKNMTIDSRNMQGYGYYSYYNQNDYEFDEKNYYYGTTHLDHMNHFYAMSKKVISKPCEYWSGTQKYVRENCREPVENFKPEVLGWKIEDFGLIHEYETFDSLNKKEHKLRYIYALDENEDVAKYEETYNKGIVYKKLSYFKPVQNYKSEIVQTGPANYGGYWGNHETKITPAIINEYDTKGNLISIYKRFGENDTSDVSRFQDRCTGDNYCIKQYDKDGNLLITHHTLYIPYLQWGDTPKHEERVFRKLSTVHPYYNIIDEDGNYIYKYIKHKKTFGKKAKDVAGCILISPILLLEYLEGNL